MTEEQIASETPPQSIPSTRRAASSAAASR